MSEAKGVAGGAGRTMPTEEMDEDEAEEKFDWKQYFSETKTNPTLPEWFFQSSTPPENRFKVGQKLEAVDPRNNTITSVATVVALFGPKIKLRLDGAGRSNDFWTLVDSSKIHPFGYTEENGGHLQPPLSYEKDPVRYQNSIINAAKESGSLAPKSCFIPEPPRPNANLFKIGTKLEATDTHHPTWICPATVIGRERDKIKIEYLGWSQVDLVRYDSRDLYPCGWWEKAGCNVSKPPSQRKKEEPPSQRKKEASPVVRRGRGRPTKSPSRPHSASAVARTNSTQEHRNIFDAVMAKKTTSPPPDLLSEPLMTSTPTQDILETTSSVADDSGKPPSVAGAPVFAAKDSAPVLLKHAARKSIAARPIFADFAAGDKKSLPEEAPSSSGKSLKNGTAVPTESNGRVLATIPEPDTVIVSQTPVKKLTLRFNENCNGGPYLDTRKLENLFAASPKELPLLFWVREAFQMLVNSARREAAVQVFNAMPTTGMKSQKALSVTGLDADGNCVIRYIPMYRTAAAAIRALTGVLVSLKSCPNLLGTTETGCNSCCEVSVAKKTKLSEDHVLTDTTRNEKSTGGADAVADVQMQNAVLAVWCGGQDPSKWEVDDVVRFISSVIDSQAAEPFRRQEIDGNALVLLTPEIMIKYMDIRVGPAVKISNAVERLKGTTRPSYLNTTTTLGVPEPDTGTKDPEYKE